MNYLQIHLFTTLVTTRFASPASRTVVLLNCYDYYRAENMIVAQHHRQKQEEEQEEDSWDAPENEPSYSAGGEVLVVMVMMTTE